MVRSIFSRHPFRWKLSTRERKKSLEDSLKASDYSEHHLIPVYGFRSNDGKKNEDDPGGTEEGGRRDRTMGVEERRTELRRVEARALAAERASMERRSRAEGGAGGAAFARAMSRRALARAEWIQKVHLPCLYHACLVCIESHVSLSLSISVSLCPPPPPPSLFLWQTGSVRTLAIGKKTGSHRVIAGILNRVHRRISRALLSKVERQEVGVRWALEGGLGLARALACVA